MIADFLHGKILKWEICFFVYCLTIEKIFLYGTLKGCKTLESVLKCYSKNHLRKLEVVGEGIWFGGGKIELGNGIIFAKFHICRGELFKVQETKIKMDLDFSCVIGSVTSIWSGMSVGRLVGWFVGLSWFSKSGKLHFQALIGALVLIIILFMAMDI